MGYAKATIRLSNARTPEAPGVEAEARVDPGSMLLCVGPEVVAELALEAVTTRDIMGPDGQVHTCPYVGPILVEFEDRACFAGALVLGSGVWLGDIQMADMDLVIDPALGRVVANPANMQPAGSHA